MTDEESEEQAKEPIVEESEAPIEEIPLAAPKTVTTRKPRVDKGLPRKPRVATAARAKRKPAIATEEQIAEQVFNTTKGLHELAALAFSTPECALSDEVAHAEADAAAAIMIQYDMTKALKFMPWLAFLGVVVMAEATPVRAVAHKLHAAKQERNRIGHVVEMNEVQPLTGINNVIHFPSPDDTPGSVA